MIYLFTGNSSILVSEQVLNWKDIFISKHGEFNLIHIKNVLDYDKNFIFENILSEAFIGQKKLIIINDLPLKSTDKEKEINEKQEFIMSLLGKVPENNIVLFSSVSPDKSGKFYKILKKIGEVNEFNSLGDDDISFRLNQKYPEKVKFNAIKEIIKYKGGKIDKIIPEIEKLLITKDIITKADIIENIYPELEESIFILIDGILNTDIVNTIHIMDSILETVNVHAFYSNLLSNLRTLFYIQQLITLKVGKQETIKVLNLGKKRGFLYDKKYKINFMQLRKLYISLIDLEIKMKTGAMLGGKDNDFKFEIKKVLIISLSIF